MVDTPEIKKIDFQALIVPKTKFDLIMDIDLINDRIDVRGSEALSLKDKIVILKQTSPPIVRSMVGKTIEATFIKRDSETGEMIRWGWHGQLVKCYDEFEDPETNEKLEAIGIALPTSETLSKTNARMDYRLSIINNDQASIQTHPSFGQVALLDFSAGGVLIGIPAPPMATLGMRIGFTLFLPVQNGTQTTINGNAEVVRIMHEEGDEIAKVGLKFIDLDLNAIRVLQKAINYFMLQEQRKNN